MYHFPKRVVMPRVVLILTEQTHSDEVEYGKSKNNISVRKKSYLERH